jgi:hypothetical protein
MPLLKAAAAALSALAAFLRFVYPTAQVRSIYREVEKYEDEIFRLGDIGDPSSKLRIDLLQKRRERALEQIRDLRSAYNHAD